MKKIYILGIVTGIVALVAIAGGMIYLYFKYGGNSIYTGNFNETYRDDYFVPGVVVVGFDVGVSDEAADKIIKDSKLKYVKTNSVNRGRSFDTNSGAKYLVKVTAGEEDKWIEYFENIESVYDASRYQDPDKVIVD